MNHLRREYKRYMCKLWKFFLCFWTLVGYGYVCKYEWVTWWIWQLTCSVNLMLFCEFVDRFIPHMGASATIIVKYSYQLLHSHINLLTHEYITNITQLFQMSIVLRFLYIWPIIAFGVTSSGTTHWSRHICPSCETYFQILILSIVVSYHVFCVAWYTHILWNI